MRTSARQSVPVSTVAEFDVTGPVVEWRGPAPHHFVVVDGEPADLVHELAREVTYGWGMVPVRLRIGATTSTTSLWPRHGGYRKDPSAPHTSQARRGSLHRGRVEVLGQA